ncbi:MAG: ATP-binding protein [Alphaproteobacteria bacterium]
MTGAAAQAPKTPQHGNPAEEHLLLEVRFLAKPDRLKLIRPVVLAAARMCGFDEQAGQDIVLATDEACQNVIVHGYKGQSDKQIALTVYRSVDRIQIQLRDTAPRVDPATAQPRDLDEIRPGGLGTHFMQAVMDDITYLQPPDGVGNLLRLTKRLPRQP